jgi:hypothetical protein
MSSATNPALLFSALSQAWASAQAGSQWKPAPNQRSTSRRGQVRSSGQPKLAARAGRRPYQRWLRGNRLGTRAGPHEGRDETGSGGPRGSRDPRGSSGPEGRPERLCRRHSGLPRPPSEGKKLVGGLKPFPLGSCCGACLPPRVACPITRSSSSVWVANSAREAAPTAWQCLWDLIHVDLTRACPRACERLCCSPSSQGFC